MENWEQENKNKYSNGQGWQKSYKRQEKYGENPNEQWSSFTDRKKYGENPNEQWSSFTYREKLEDNNTSEFWDVVQNAVNTGDYKSLNKQVRNVINDTVDGISQVGEAVKTVGTEWARRAQDYANAKRLPVLYAKNPPGQVSGTLMTVGGFAMTGMFGLTTLLCGIGTIATGEPGGAVATALMGIFTGISLALGITGNNIRKFVKRFKYYVRYLGQKTYCSIEELAHSLGKSEEFVKKDLKKMIDKEMFLQGHLDRQETCLIVSDDMYKQYVEVQRQADIRQQEEIARKQKESAVPEESRRILEEGREYIAYISQCNAEIPDALMTEKLNRLELIITRIFREVENNPSIAGDLRKFMNYYLPTTRKLVDAYRDMEKETFQGENIENTKKEIEDTIDTINEAFENLLNSFFKERAMDISSDISVLHTMLAQEGLKKGAFDQK